MTLYDYNPTPEAREFKRLVPSAKNVRFYPGASQHLTRARRAAHTNPNMGKTKPATKTPAKGAKAAPAQTKATSAGAAKPAAKKARSARA